jgi:hypothetical protein
MSLNSFLFYFSPHPLQLNVKDVFKERVNEGKYGGCILYSYIKNRRMKHVEIVLRRGTGKEGEQWRG